MGGGGGGFVVGGGGGGGLAFHPTVFTYPYSITYTYNMVSQTYRILVSLFLS